MNPFLIRISHETFTKKLRAKQSNYCIYLSQWMLLFISSIHISAILGVCVAPRLGSIWGPRVILLCGSLLSLVGIYLASWFPHVSVEVLGMILIGLGVGRIHKLCIWAVFYTKLEPLHHVKKSVAYIVLGVVPIYSFAASALMLPHGWLGDSYPAECRALGFVWRISFTMVMNIFMVQTLLHFLCSLHKWLFFSLAVVSLITASFVYFFVPETTDVDEDAMVDEVWRRHWFWRQYMADERRNET